MLILLALILAQARQAPCLTSNGNAACARTPWGNCAATMGRIFCGDPSWETLHVLREPPQVECATTNGKGACGYDCKTAVGQVACASSPWGRCVTSVGRITCSD